MSGPNTDGSEGNVASVNPIVAPAVPSAAMATSGFPVLPPPPLGNPLLPFPNGMPVLLPNMMFPPTQVPNMMGFFPPAVPSFQPSTMAPPTMPTPDSSAVPTQATGTNDVRPAFSPAGLANGFPSVSPVAIQPPQLLAQAFGAGALHGADVSTPIIATASTTGTPAATAAPATAATRSQRRITIRDPRTGDDVTEKVRRLG